MRIRINLAATALMSVVVAFRPQTNPFIPKLPPLFSVGVYVHIPFCRRRCRYCNFAIVPGARSDSSSFLEMASNYTNAVLSEIDRVAVPSSVVIDSIYFGGGTPSVAPPTLLADLLTAIRHKFNVSNTAELTIEMDPGTFDQAKLEQIAQMGFSRISLGVQSFDDTILESLGRLHRRQDVFQAVELLRDVYGDSLNYSVDLISAVPGLSLPLWCETLQTALQLDPPPQHLSVYDLQVEQGTVFGTLYGTNALFKPNIPALPSEDDAAFMYQYAAGYLRSRGYEHYEVSSYALAAHRSRHNQIYWDYDGQWYAFGMGATSFVDQRIQARPKTLFDYQRWATEEYEVEQQQVNSSRLDRLLDVVLKRLRTSEGISLHWVRENYGEKAVSAILRGAQLGVELDLVVVEKSVLRLVDPRGLLFSNTIISCIFVELDRDM